MAAKLSSVFEYKFHSFYSQANCPSTVRQRCEITGDHS
jgi:hypothetical protein